MGRAERLEALADLSLERKFEILQIVLDPLDPDYLKLAQLVNEASTQMLSNVIKIDENHFRKRSGDALVQILEKITAAERAQVVSQ